jgi:hypothetical protein
VPFVPLDDIADSKQERTGKTRADDLPRDSNVRMLRIVAMLAVTFSILICNAHFRMLVGSTGCIHDDIGGRAS